MAAGPAPARSDPARLRPDSGLEPSRRSRPGLHDAAEKLEEGGGGVVMAMLGIIIILIMVMMMMMMTTTTTMTRSRFPRRSDYNNCDDHDNEDSCCDNYDNQNISTGITTIVIISQLL